LLGGVLRSAILRSTRSLLKSRAACSNCEIRCGFDENGAGPHAAVHDSAERRHQ
jgi:hypothetical protein